jgi:hypothetical protein
LTLSEEDDEEEDEDDLLLLLLLRFLRSSDSYRSLLISGQSFFLNIRRDVPMALSAAQSAFVIGLRSLRLLRLACNLDADSLIADFLSVHAVDSFVKRLL